MTKKKKKLHEVREIPEKGGIKMCYFEQLIKTYLRFGELCESISVQTGEVCVNVGQCPLRLGQQLKPTSQRS